jgi:hypothetical protein
MNTTGTKYADASEAILGTIDPDDGATRLGVTICLAAGTEALANGNHDIAGAMLDEAAARAGMISDEQLRHLHRARLAGSRS